MPPSALPIKKPRGRPPASARRKNTEKGYSLYLHKVHRQMHPKEKGISISSTAMEVLNFLIENTESRVCNSAFDLAIFEKKSTLSAKHVQVATKMVFPSEMGGMAVSEGTKALTKFLASKR